MNPYGKMTKVLRSTGEPALEAMKGGGWNRNTQTIIPGTAPAFAKTASGNLELNANNMADLMQQMSYLMKQYSGDITTRPSITKQAAALVEERENVLLEALNDKSGEAFERLGEVITDEIIETMDRQGFSRTILAIRPTPKGQDARVRVRKKDVVAFMATEDIHTTEQRIRQFYVYPADYYLVCLIMIQDKEIEQASQDLLDEKFNDGLGATMVREDKITRTLSTRAAPVFNDIIYFGSFNPSVLTTMRTQVNRWGAPAANMLISFDIWDDIIADADFVSWFSEVHKHELILEGRLGSLLGVNIITDGFRYDTLKVLEPGEVFVYAAPVAVGAITQRKELISRPVDQYMLGRPARGWFLEQIQGTTIANARGLCWGQRT